jgi:hypothetical protein
MNSFSGSPASSTRPSAPHDSLAHHAGHAEDFIIVEDAQRARFIHFFGDGLHSALRNRGERARGKIGEAKTQDAMPEPVYSASGFHIPQQLQRNQNAANGRARQAGVARDFSDRQPLGMALERFNDAQAAGQRQHEIRIALEGGELAAPAGLKFGKARRGGFVRYGYLARHKTLDLLALDLGTA